MTISEYIKSEYKKVKQKPPKERWEYFWDYYKIPAICTLLVVVLLAQGVVSLVNHRETAFSAVLLNCRIGVEGEEFLEGFYEYAGFDGNTYTAAFYTDMTLVDGQNQNNTNTFQRIMAGVVIQDTDFIAGPPVAFQMCAYNSGSLLMDLRNFLDEETLSRLSDRLYYIDGAVLENLRAPVGQQVEPALLTYPDPTKPELMEDPIPVGIDISDRKAFVDAYYFPDNTVYFGVVPNTLRPELTASFIDYLFLE